MTLMVPVMVSMLMAHPEFRPERIASLESLVYGAAPMPAGLLDQILERASRRRPLPGLRHDRGELGADDARSGRPPARQRGVRHSAGRAVLGVSISVRDEDGQPVPTGESGEVCAQGGNFMREYWNRPDETAEAFHGGWYHTGDMGYLDPSGYLYLVDRVKDMIVTGGENVYSIEVENAISTHPGVAEVAVIGIPHELWGEAVHAIVVPKPDATLTESEIIDWAKSTIAAYKVPKSVAFHTEPLPLSGALKPLKRDLRAPCWAGRERSV